jgi:UDP-glucuronate 4-epimerase
MKKILITGAAGFIGFHVSKKLLEEGYEIIGIDNLNDYYDVKLKEDRLKILEENPQFSFERKDISEELDIERADAIIHLAAQAGVRYSIENPLAYEKSNNLGTLQVFEYARKNNIKTVVYASSSSVYGNMKDAPFKESYQLDKPISLYAATKKNNELVAYTYHHLYGINMTGLRFFTVYGPWGRPDMALFKFTEKILKEDEIEVYNNGEMHRDFTYIDDIVTGVVSALKNNYPYEVFNLARGETVKLTKFVEAIEDATGKKARIRYEKLQPGDVLITSGDITHAKEKLGYEPKTSVREGVQNFVKWYREYYGM